MLFHGIEAGAASLLLLLFQLRFTDCTLYQTTGFKSLPPSVFWPQLWVWDVGSVGRELNAEPVSLHHGLSSRTEPGREDAQHASHQWALTHTPADHCRWVKASGHTCLLPQVARASPTCRCGSTYSWETSCGGSARHLCSRSASLT